MSGKKPTKIEKEVKKCKEILKDDVLCEEFEQKSREGATKECNSITSDRGKEQCMQKYAGFEIKRKVTIQKNKKKLLPIETKKDKEEETRLAEEKRKEEEKRLAEEKQKKEEEKRLAKEKQKKEEEKRLAKEKQKKEEEKKRLAKEKQKKEEKRLVEEKRKEEEKRLAEEKRKEEEKRLAEEKRKEEEKRLAEEKRKEEEKRLAKCKTLQETSIAATDPDAVSQESNKMEEDAKTYKCDSLSTLIARNKEVLRKSCMRSVTEIKSRDAPLKEKLDLIAQISVCQNIPGVVDIVNEINQLLECDTSKSVYKKEKDEIVKNTKYLDNKTFKQGDFCKDYTKEKCPTTDGCKVKDESCQPAILNNTKGGLLTSRRKDRRLTSQKIKTALERLKGTLQKNTKCNFKDFVDGEEKLIDEKQTNEKELTLKTKKKWNVLKGVVTGEDKTRLQILKNIKQQEIQNETNDKNNNEHMQRVKGRKKDTLEEDVLKRKEDKSFEYNEAVANTWKNLESEMLSLKNSTDIQKLKELSERILECYTNNSNRLNRFRQVEKVEFGIKKFDVVNDTCFVDRLQSFLDSNPYVYQSEETFLQKIKKQFKTDIYLDFIEPSWEKVEKELSDAIPTVGGLQFKHFVKEQKEPSGTIEKNSHPLSTLGATLKEIQEYAEECLRIADMVKATKDELENQKKDFDAKRKSREESWSKRTIEYNKYTETQKKARTVVDMAVKADSILFSGNPETRTKFVNGTIPATIDLDAWGSVKDKAKVQSLMGWVSGNQQMIQRMQTTTAILKDQKTWKRSDTIFQHKVLVNQLEFLKDAQLNTLKGLGNAKNHFDSLQERVTKKYDKLMENTKYFHAGLENFKNWKQYDDVNLVTDIEDLLGTIRIVARGLNRAWTKNQSSDNHINPSENKKRCISFDGKDYGPFHSMLLPKMVDDDLHNPKNAELYQNLNTTLDRVKDGKSVTTVAYGYSGSGKTYGFFHPVAPSEEIYSVDDPGIVYQFFKENKDNIASVGVYVRELYGESEDASTLFLSTMTGNLLEYTNEDDLRENISWRGVPLVGKMSMYVEDETRAFDTGKISVVETPVDFVNLMDPKNKNSLYGVVTGNSKRTSTLTQGDIGLVIRHNGKVGVYTGEQEMEIFKSHVTRGNDERKESKEDGDIYFLGKQTFDVDGNLKTDASFTDKKEWTFVRELNQTNVNGVPYNANLYKRVEKVSGAVEVLSTPIERALSLENKYRKLPGDDFAKGFKEVYSAVEEIRRGDRVLKTPNNPDSSRGHLFISLKISFNNGKTGFWNIGDLAGSENPLSIASDTFGDKNWPNFFRDNLCRNMTLPRKESCSELERKIPETTNNYDKNVAWKIIKQGFFINESNMHLMAYARSKDPQLKSYNLEYGKIDLGTRKSSDAEYTVPSGVDGTLQNWFDGVKSDAYNKWFKDQDQAYTVRLYRPFENDNRRPQSIPVCIKGDRQIYGKLPAMFQDNTWFGGWFGETKQLPLKITSGNTLVRGGEVFAELITSGDNQNLREHIQYDPHRAAQNPVAYIHGPDAVRLSETQYRAFLEASVRRKVEPCQKKLLVMVPKQEEEFLQGGAMTDEQAYNHVVSAMKAYLQSLSDEKRQTMKDYEVEWCDINDNVDNLETFLGKTYLTKFDKDGDKETIQKMFKMLKGQDEIMSENLQAPYEDDCDKMLTEVMEEKKAKKKGNTLNDIFEESFGDRVIGDRAGYNSTREDMIRFIQEKHPKVFETSPQETQTLINNNSNLENDNKKLKRLENFLKKKLAEGKKKQDELFYLRSCDTSYKTIMSKSVPPMQKKKELDEHFTKNEICQSPKTKYNDFSSTLADEIGKEGREKVMTDRLKELNGVETIEELGPWMTKAIADVKKLLPMYDQGTFHESESYKKIKAAHDAKKKTLQNTWWGEETAKKTAALQEQNNNFIAIAAWKENALKHLTRNWNDTEYLITDFAKEIENAYTGEVKKLYKKRCTAIMEKLKDPKEFKVYKNNNKAMEVLEPKNDKTRNKVKEVFGDEKVCDTTQYEGKIRQILEEQKTSCLAKFEEYKKTLIDNLTFSTPLAKFEESACTSIISKKMKNKFKEEFLHQRQLLVKGEQERIAQETFDNLVTEQKLAPTVESIPKKEFDVEKYEQAYSKFVEQVSAKTIIDTDGNILKEKIGKKNETYKRLLKLLDDMKTKVQEQNTKRLADCQTMVSKIQSTEPAQVQSAEKTREKMEDCNDKDKTDADENIERMQQELFDTTVKSTLRTFTNVEDVDNAIETVQKFAYQKAASKTLKTLQGIKEKLEEYRHYFSYDLVTRQMLDDNIVDRWNNITTFAIDRWNKWNETRKGPEPTRGFVLMIPLLNSYMALDKSKMVIVQNMRSETSMKPIQKEGVKMTLEFSDSINPMSFQSAGEIRCGNTRSLAYELHKDCDGKHNLLRIDHYLSSMSGKSEFPVYSAANTNTIVKNINYAEKVTIEKFVRKDGNVWKFAKIKDGYLDLYNDDGNAVFRIRGDGNHFGPWVSTWDEQYFQAIHDQNNEEMISVLTSDLIRFDDLVQSSDEESFMDDTILLTDDEESYMF
jgi:hypothetical protein